MRDYLKEAYKEAQKAFEIDEVPVGAVIVSNDKIIARSHNLKETKNNPLAHAEILAINKACKKLGKWRLEDCDIYVTLEPCSMCLSALIHARIKNIYYGAIDKRFGSIEGAFNLLDVGKFNHYPQTIYIEEECCSKILSEYFKNKRKTKSHNDFID